LASFLLDTDFKTELCLRGRKMARGEGLKKLPLVAKNRMFEPMRRGSCVLHRTTALARGAGEESALVASTYEQTKAACVVQDRNPYCDQNQRSHALAVAADWLAERGVVDDPVGKKAP
jgi:hypothetical protein